MKKIFNFLTAIVLVTTVMIFANDAVAQVEEEVEGGDGKITCYSTYDSGTTNFTKCNGCVESTGTSLRDKGDCRL